MHTFSICTHWQISVFAHSFAVHKILSVLHFYYMVSQQCGQMFFKISTVDTDLYYAWIIEI